MKIISLQFKNKFVDVYDEKRSEKIASIKVKDPFNNQGEIINWIENNLLTERYPNLIAHFACSESGISIVFDEKMKIAQFYCSFNIPDYIDIKNAVYKITPFNLLYYFLL